MLPWKKAGERPAEQSKTKTERHVVIIGNFLGKPASSKPLRACSAQQRGQERWLPSLLRSNCSMRTLAAAQGPAGHQQLGRAAVPVWAWRARLACSRKQAPVSSKQHRGLQESERLLRHTVKHLHAFHSLFWRWQQVIDALPVQLVKDSGHKCRTSQDNLCGQLTNWLISLAELV